jgi:hypothetical protein
MKILKFGIHTYVRKDIVDKLLTACVKARSILDEVAQDWTDLGNRAHDFLAILDEAIAEWERILSAVEIRDTVIQARKETNPIVSLTKEEHEELIKFADALIKYETDHDIKAFQKAVNDD